MMMAGLTTMTKSGNLSRKHGEAANVVVCRVGRRGGACGGGGVE